MKRFLTTAAIALSMTTVAQAANHTIMFAGNYWRVTHMARSVGLSMRTVTALAALFLLLVPSHPANAEVVVKEPTWREKEDDRCERKVQSDLGAELARQKRREACRLHPDKECKAWVKWLDRLERAGRGPKPDFYCQDLLEGSSSDRIL